MGKPYHFYTLARYLTVLYLIRAGFNGYEKTFGHHTLEGVNALLDAAFKRIDNDQRPSF